MEFPFERYFLTPKTQSLCREKTAPNSNVLLMVVEFGDRQFHNIIESKSMKKVITILMAVASSFVFGYQDLLELVELKKTAEMVQQYNEVESFAELKLWVLEQTQPRIFIEIETADNATDVGYFRIDYRNAGKLGKIGLLREYFNIK